MDTTVPRNYIRGSLLSVYIIVATLVLALPMLFGARRLIARTWCKLCRRALGVKFEVHGTPLSRRPALFIGNHISYVDILLLGDVLNIPTFVAKQDVAHWPVLGPLTRLLGIVFIHRDRPEESAEQIRTLAERLKRGERLVLFPEGTSSHGLDLLPFKSTLLGCAYEKDGGVPDVAVQPVSIVFGHNEAGAPLPPIERARFGWVGDDPLVPHAWDMLTSPSATVTVRFHDPLNAKDFPNRKALNAKAYEVIRSAVVSSEGDANQEQPSSQDRAAA